MNNRQIKKYCRKIANREKNDDSLNIKRTMYVDSKGRDMYPFEAGKLITFKIPHIKKSNRSTSLRKWTK